MNLESYKYFVTAAEELNFTQAAKKLYITQQALSKQIDKIEKYYNARLFNREMPMSLTPAGECLYRHMCRIMDEERQMRNELDGILRISGSRLTVGASYYRSSVLLPRLIAEFSREHPGIRIDVRENSLSKTVEALKLGKVDLMFGYAEPEDQTLLSKPILEECVVFALHRKKAGEYFLPEELAAMKAAGIASLRQFSRCPFIRLSPRTWLGDLFDRCCREEKLEPRVVLDSSSVLTTLGCCMEGMGAALIPSLYLRELTDQEREQLFLVSWDYPYARCHSAILYLKSSYESEAARDFVRTAQRVCTAWKEELDLYLK